MLDKAKVKPPGRQQAKTIQNAEVDANLSAHPSRQIVAAFRLFAVVKAEAQRAAQLLHPRRDVMHREARM
jgi:hypothetical protein